MAARTIDEALERFELVSGTGSESSNTACVMTLLAWVTGAAWSDDLPCAHPTIRRLAITANDHDATTSEDRARIVRAGEAGILDTWWVPTVVVVAAIAGAPTVADVGIVAHTVAVLDGVAAWKSDPARPRPNLNGANLNGANLDGANLNGANLDRASLNGASLNGASLYRANLNGASLYRASLYRANLNGASLNGASLYGASLNGARGDAATKLPAGWRVAESGLIVRDAS